MKKLLYLGIVLSLALLPACYTEYYRLDPTVQGWAVGAGQDTGPRGDAPGFVQPTVVEYVLATKEAGLDQYYDALQHFETMRKRVNIFTKQMYAGAERDLTMMKTRFDAMSDEEQKKLAGPEKKELGKAYARIAASLLAPYVVKSLRENGYAIVTWGQKVAEDHSELKMGQNMLYVTIHPETDIVRVHASDIYANMAVMVGKSFDVAEIDGVWDHSKKVDYDTVVQQIRHMTEGNEPEAAEGEAEGEGEAEAAPAEAEAAPAEAEAAPAEGEAAPAEAEAAPAEGEAAPAEGGE